MTAIDALDYLFITILVLIALQVFIVLFLLLYNFPQDSFDQKFK